MAKYQLKKAGPMAKKLALACVAVSFASTLMFPASIYGVDTLSVNNQQYTAASNGEGWDWDGAEAMTLSGFNGGNIFGDTGDLTVSVYGENQTGSITVTGGNLTVQGITEDASLDINTHLSGIGNAYTFDKDGELDETPNDVTVKDVNVNINVKMQHNNNAINQDIAGIAATGNVILENVTGSIDSAGFYAEFGGSTVEFADEEGIVARTGNVTISNSNIEVTTHSGNEDNAWPALAAGTAIAAKEGTVTIQNSTVNIDAETLPVYAKKDIVLENDEIKGEAQVVDINATVSDYGYSATYTGKTIGTANISDITSDAIAKQVVIDKPAQTSTEAKAPQTKVTTSVAAAAVPPAPAQQVTATASATAQTADPISTSTIAAVAALALFAACGLMAARKVQK